jgi:hypothetical protein
MRARIFLALPWATLVACAGGTTTLSQTSRDGSGSSSGGEGAGSSSSSSGGPSRGSSGSGSSSGGGDSGDDGGTSPGNLTGDAGPGSTTGSNGCTAEATNFVYVLSAEADLYSFAPSAKQFTKIGALNCGQMAEPNSMAVDRNANAYVNYSFSVVPSGFAGTVFKVSTQNASCGAAPVLTLPLDWAQIGMGFSTIGNSSSEALYVASQGGSQGLGLLDFGKGTVGPIGPFTGVLAGKQAELTGTGDGRLFGFFTTTPVYVAQIDKASGATTSPVPMTGVPTPTDFAFSFWGGHFYLYVSQGSGTTVVDYDPTTGAVNPSYMPNIGFDIVGAGVSTCAPTLAPQ